MEHHIYSSNAVKSIESKLSGGTLSRWKSIVPQKLPNETEETTLDARPSPVDFCSAFLQFVQAAQAHL